MSAPQDHAVLILGGRKYRPIGLGYGAQLESLEWRRPAAGTQRTLAGCRFTVFQTVRDGLRVRATWGLAHSGNLDSQRAALEEMARIMRRLVYV